MMDHQDTDALLDTYLAAGTAERSARTDGPVHSITFVKRSGNRWSLMYSHLLWVYFNPSLGLRVQFSTHCISIEGHRLAKLSEALADRSASLVREVDERYADSDLDEDPVVTSIRALPNNGRGEPFALPEGVKIQSDPE
jgi:predicted DNA-binding protein